MFNGVPIAANEDGIFSLDTAQTDDGVLIDAFVELVSTDFGTLSPKRVRSAEIGYETSGYLIFKVKTDDNSELVYTMQPDKTGQKQYAEKLPLSRWQKGVTWRFRVENRDGCDSCMSSQELSISASEVARRFNQDRSAVNRAAQRVGNDAELMPAAIKILEQLQP